MSSSWMRAAHNANQRRASSRLIKSRDSGIFHVHEVTNSGLTTEVKGRAEGKGGRMRRGDTDEERAVAEPRTGEEKRLVIDEKIERDRRRR